MSEIKIGLQMYTVRDECAQDFPGTLRKVAEIGYKYVELAGTYGLSPEALKDVLDDCGLAAISTHEGLDPLRDDMLAVLARCKTLGIEYIVCPYAQGTNGSDPAVWDGLAKDFNAIGKSCSDAGFTFGYHNHAHEYVMVNGMYGLDYLMEKTDPNLVKMEVDAGWTWFAGVDPAEYIRKHGSRVALIHAKDHDAANKDLNRPVGDGALNWKAIFDACHEVGTKVAIVEEDRTIAPALESVARSFANLKAMGLA
ncbi:MAG TPA: sugar phosphate isomerase/epimerase [Armatimonadota bacterium]|jgi:sugar phosphate isomerase/epimerase